MRGLIAEQRSLQDLDFLSVKASRGITRALVVVGTLKVRLCPADASYCALSLLRWKPDHESVLIKPNIDAISKRTNTDPEIVRGIIRYVKAQGIKDIVVGEGSVETEYESTPYNFHYAGRCCVAEKGVGLSDLK